MRILFLLFVCCCFLSSPAMAAPSFDRWVADFKKEASSKGISHQTLEEAFKGVKLNKRVLILDKKQPEGTTTLQRYLTSTVTNSRIQTGRKMMSNYRGLLRKISKKYGVQPRFIVALWGIETGYGSNMGGMNVIESLATLAHDGRRSAFFRKELLNALTIIEQGHITAPAMKGSWAGAMGQCQFMPSTFLNFAVDHNRNGKRDIWRSKADTFASMANYLRSLQWTNQENWGRPIKLPEDFDTTLIDIDIVKTLPEWKALGVRKADGGALPVKKGMNASVIWVGEGKDAKSYIVYHNFKALLNWNRSRYFATAVGTLADAIK